MTDLLTIATEVKKALYGDDYDIETEEKFNFAIIKKTIGDITYEEFWILSNAYYDYDVERFVKIDTTHNSFGIQIQANGSYPGEAELGYTDNVGINIWRNGKSSEVYKDTTTFDYTDFDDNKYIGAKRRSNNKWEEFGVASGWNNSFMVDSYGGMTIGGAGFEVDGNGIFPYTRLTSSAYTDENNDVWYLLGLLENAYHPTTSGWDCDKNDNYSWFVGLKTPNRSGTYLIKENSEAKFVVMYNDNSGLAANADEHILDVGSWITIFEISTSGIKGMVNGNLTPLGSGGNNITLADSVTDGDTTHAVTPNAVYDALTLKQDINSAFDGDYDNLTNKPSIPTDVSDLTDTSNTEFTPKAHSHTEFADSDWVDLTLTGNFYNFDNNHKVQYRKVGKHVQIVGLPVLNANPAANSELIIGSLPTGYIPSHEMSFLCELKDDEKLWTCIVKTNGDITFNRLRDGTGFVAGTAYSDVLKLNVQYLIG